MTGQALVALRRCPATSPVQGSETDLAWETDRESVIVPALVTVLAQELTLAWNVRATALALETVRVLETGLASATAPVRATALASVIVLALETDPGLATDLEQVIDLVLATVPALATDPDKVVAEHNALAYQATAPTGQTDPVSDQATSIAPSFVRLPTGPLSMEISITTTSATTSSTIAQPG